MDLVIVWFIACTAPMRRYDIRHFSQYIGSVIFYKYAFPAISIYPVNTIVAKVSFMQIRVRKSVVFYIRSF
jgi:hypothetical protein